MSKNDIYIIGSGHTPFGRLSQTLEELIVAAAREAVAEAQVNPGEIDALCLGHFNSGLVPDGFASSLILQAFPELRFKPATRYENACASGAAALHGGLNLIRSGSARRVLVVGVEKMTHRATEEVTSALAGAGYQNDEAEARLSFPQVFALAAELYGARYGDPSDVMARIAFKNHANAMRNPLAQMRKPVTFEFCREVSEKNPLIAPPLRLTDCSLVSDGAAAVVLSSADAAASARQRARVAAAVHCSDFLPMSGRDFVAFEGPERAIAEAYRTAAIGPDELDFAEVHDCFTIAELLIYEAMGLAPKGRGARAIEDGTVMAEGKTPVNLSGGLKAKGHPVGATGVSMHALSFRQLTGQAGDMQRAGAEWGLIFNMGGAAVANYATLLQADRA
ncbi:thiolase domain-containing protein [Rhodoblastus acidophilus]|uniref:Thiolase domain-containing protein n=1 Tax=Candidatus Rhodoblastus alkanivorans TaxID=2954117 RepID=A0ABS9Z7H6_9HYPH|nr:thiolase domain-containing protein [Candidatus Rhodoblastus alkanivorans]MCI4683653.1 thiolase domain-containing protein [Candidatus Rhodoblastus alkanivorans]MDI4640969.1 thiolase domain-containing protein [Rhodoblastus acidophilus]